MDMNENPKAALYIRVSTEEQAEDGQSADAQVENLRQYCCAYGIKVFDVYMDLGLSGKSLKDRKELSRLLQDCTKGHFNMVLVWKISRLSRNLKDLLYLIDIFEKHGVHFASRSEMFDTSTPVGRMTLQLLGSIAEFERNTIVENVRLGLREFARKGGKASSVLGYDNSDKRLVVNENEAEIVKLIFKLYTKAAMNYSAIARYLNNAGYRTKRGCEFRSSNISYIIHNPVYIGINRHGVNSEKEYSVPGTQPPIIDEETWNEAQSLNRSTGKGSCCRHAADTLPFMVFCSKCNSVMKVFYTISKGKRYKYMRCCRCSNYVNAGKLLNAAGEALIRLLCDKARREQAYSLLKKELAVKKPENTCIAEAEAEIKALRKSRKRYLKLFEGYKISDTSAFIERISEIESRIRTLEKKLTSVIPEDCEKYFSELAEKLHKAEPSAIGQLSCLIKSISAFRDDINVVLYL